MIKEYDKSTLYKILKTMLVYFFKVPKVGRWGSSYVGWVNAVKHIVPKLSTTNKIILFVKIITICSIF